MSEIRPIKNAADHDVVRFVIWRAVIDGSDQFRYATEDNAPGSIRVSMKKRI
mgnify:CR=1 FL=1